MKITFNPNLYQGDWEVYEEFPDGTRRFRGRFANHLEQYKVQNKLGWLPPKDIRCVGYFVERGKQ